MKSATVKTLLVAIVAIVLAGPVVSPALLAFPYHSQVGAHQVWSAAPLPPTLGTVVERADAKVAASPSGTFRRSDQPIFLTDGGWRWRWLSLGASGAFALTRPVNDAIIVNRADPATDMAFNGDPIAGQRHLSGVIAHEMTHGSLRAHFGMQVDWRYPATLREGYCDYVAGESSLSDSAAEAMIARGTSHPALPYWIGRRQVARTLAQPGATLESVFAKAD
jgi:hypothetical protein